MPTLVCLMPLFNHVDSLNKSVMSILMQKTNFDFKLIIIDDCSSDGSYELALELENKYRNKIVVHRNQENLKLLKSMYNGYFYLKGYDYFCVLDPDDWYISEDKFQVAVDFLESNKNFSMYMDNVKLLKEFKEDLLVNSKIKSFDFSFDDYQKGKQCVFVQTSGVIYRNLYFKESYNKDFAEILKYPFPRSFEADGFRWFWYLKSGPAHFCNIPKSVYNYNEQGIWSKLQKIDQDFLNVQLFISCSQFFVNDHDFFQKKAFKELINSLINLKDMNALNEERRIQLKEILTFLDFFKNKISLFNLFVLAFNKIFYNLLLLLNYKRNKMKSKLLALKTIKFLSRM